VTEKNDESWRQLCAQAAVEQDPTRLMELVAEINRLLAEKHKRLQVKSEHPAPPEPLKGNS
jgi:hypothetical protein